MPCTRWQGKKGGTGGFCFLTGRGRGTSEKKILRKILQPVVLALTARKKRGRKGVASWSGGREGEKKSGRIGEKGAAKTLVADSGGKGGKKEGRREINAGRSRGMGMIWQCGEEKKREILTTTTDWRWDVETKGKQATLARGEEGEAGKLISHK